MRAASAHTAGSAIFSSIAASSRFSRAESKILPQLADPLAHRGVSIFQIVDHAVSLRHFSKESRESERQVVGQFELRATKVTYNGQY
jgi:hypothetical protein